MLDCSNFYQLLRDQGIGFFTGVPDSLLKDFCACITDTASPNEHVIAANEGGAVGLATGHYLATGKPSLVYLQNSGQGNAINPLLSICDPEVYGIPMLMLVGWRGQPGVHDEPQHVKQGRVMNALFDAMEVPFEILAGEAAAAERQVKGLLERSVAERRPVALVVGKGTFSAYAPRQCTRIDMLSREYSIEVLLDLLPPEAAVVATTGHIAREVYACRKKSGKGHGSDFLMVGGMGHASQVALGLAMAQPDRPVFCFDGDGATLMHMGGLALVGQSKCSNLKHIVLNNGAHGSVGGQPSLGLKVGLPDIARASGYGMVGSADTEDDLMLAGKKLVTVAGPAFLEVCVSTDARSNLERPATTPMGNKQSLMDFLDDH